MRTSKTDVNEEDVGSYGGRKETVWCGGPHEKINRCLTDIFKI